MTADQRRRSVRAMLVFLSLCGAVLVHFTIVERFSPALGAMLSLVPIALAVAWAARRAGRREWTLAALAIVVVAGWLCWGALERNFASVFFAEHAGSNLALAYVFGHTLAEGHEPLCTRFARALHGALPPEVAAYTRRVTVAWTVFFAALAAVSAALYLGGFLAAWSALATMLSPVLLGLMFVGEYAVRVRALPHWERTGIFGAVRAFSRHVATARLETPR